MPHLAQAAAIAHKFSKAFAEGIHESLYYRRAFAVVAAVGMSFLLNVYQRDSYAAFTTSGARVSDPDTT